MPNALVLPLDTPVATLENAGGKGANLARLVRAGFNVPPGFILTTRAYQSFVAANDLEPAIQEALRQTGLIDPLVSSSPSHPISTSPGRSASATIRQRFSEGRLPDEIATALRQADADIGSPPVAVRSSATAEDLPGMSFAGQQDTFLNVVDTQSLLESVVACWSSLWTARAIGYRARNGISHADVSLAVVVQRMLPADVSGVMFTANPLTGARHETVIDATLGLGEALVSGQVEPDHYVVDTNRKAIVSKSLGAKARLIRGKEGGGVEVVSQDAGQRQALSDDQIFELVDLGSRVAREYDFPQDVEWALVDADLYLLQSRPITSLFPLPENSNPSELRVLFSFGAVQGMLDPMTPLGRDAIRLIFAGGASLLGYERTHTTQGVIRIAGERLWGDVTALFRNRLGRRLTSGALNFIEPGVRQAFEHIENDPRLSLEVAGPSFDVLRRMAPLALSIFARVLRLWRHPVRQRARYESHVEGFVGSFERDLEALRTALHASQMDTSGPETTLPRAVALYRRMYEAFPTVVPTLVPGIAAAMSLFTALHRLSARLSSDENLSTVALELTRGVPHNVTTEMDLALWATAQAIRRDHAAFDRFQGADPKTQAQEYLSGHLSPAGQAAVAEFLDAYGMRGVGEIDIGRPRWREDPTQVMQVLSSYLHIQDPSQAPDAVFERGARAGRAAIDRLDAAVRNEPGGRLRVRLVRWAASRVRALIGLRESPKFYIIRMMGFVRQGLLETGADLVARGLLEQPDDLFFLELDELDTLAGEPSLERFTACRACIASRRTDYQREKLRRQVPRLLLSDGRAFYEGLGASAGEGGQDGVITGSPVSPGLAEGRVRVVLDPHTTALAPGEILVCPGTDPAWTPLFLAAGALVMEVGGMMTHGSVVAREYGIPAVVGVHQATTRLQTGQRVRVDGTAGRITLLDPAS